MAKNENLQRNIRHEKVVLEKKGDHVEISGNYTKRELRQLLLSPTVSPLLSDDEDVSMLTIYVTQFFVLYIKRMLFIILLFLQRYYNIFIFLIIKIFNHFIFFYLTS